MPRIAVKDYDTSFFHIMVQGIRKEYIFNTNEDKKMYLKLIEEYLEKFEIKIISYCIMSNHAHLLVYVDKIENMSEFMRGINTTYAMYYNRIYDTKGYVFRNRYKIEPIYTEKYLVNCMHYIHDNPIKAKMCKKMDEYLFSSYYEYKTGKGKIIKKSMKKYAEFNNMFINHVFDIKEIDYSYIDYEKDKEYLDKEIVLKEFIEKYNLSVLEIKKDKEILRKISIELKNKCKITHEEISKILGISRSTVIRLINAK